MTDLSPVLSNVTAIALASLALVQALTNGVKLIFPTAPSGALMAAAILGGVGLVNLLALAAGLPFTTQTMALHTLAGLMAGFSAMGLHEMGSAASNKRFNALYAANFDADDSAANGAG